MSHDRLRMTYLAAALAPLALIRTVSACPLHDGTGIAEPVGVWPSGWAKSTSTLSSPLLSAASITDPSVTAWKINTTNAKGHSPNATINALVSVINADVQTVAYDSTNVYMRTTGVPSHDVGPFTANPAAPSDRNRTVRIPRAPAVNNATKTTVGLGPIGVMVNGVAFFDPRDAMSYSNQNVWHQNANVFEAASFDTGPGHPAPDNASTTTPKTGNYHYHQAPLQLLNQIDPGNTGQHHSPILGFAFDGFPVYGPYGYANADGTGGIIRESSSYVLRSITQRHTLADGTVLATNRWGPDVSAQYPLGSYIEDYTFSSGAGTLDLYNGRFSVTPEYPQGTFAYFLSLNAAGTSAYPYVIGPKYYGVVDTGNIGAGTITVPSNVTYYAPPPGQWKTTDGGNWAEAYRWTDAVVPNGTTSVARLWGNIATPATVDLGATDRTVQTLSFDSSSAYTLAGSGGGRLFLAAGGSIQALSGSHTISARIVLAGDATITPPEAGTLAVGVIDGAGRALTLTRGVLKLSAAGSAFSKVAALALAGGTTPTATLDIASAGLAIDYTGASPLATAVAQIKSARNGVDANVVTRWDGQGITSAAARAGNVAAGFDLYDIGAINNADLANPNIARAPYTALGGQSVDSTALLLRFTYSGDADLNGFVDGDDYALIDNTFNGLIPNFGWLSGDFNYDGNIDGDDYALIDSGYLFQGSPVPAAAIQSVPEPAAGALAAVAAFGLLRQRRCAAPRWSRRAASPRRHDSTVC